MSFLKYLKEQLTNNKIYYEFGVSLLGEDQEEIKGAGMFEIKFKDIYEQIKFNNITRDITLEDYANIISEVAIDIFLSNKEYTNLGTENVELYNISFGYDIHLNITTHDENILKNELSKLLLNSNQLTKDYNNFVIELEEFNHESVLE
jgi:hypothetical protein